ncbi:hydroxymethylbilane synthase [Actinophytocola xanthii]|uniref:Hydroxymethylbilane synthase n=1 Tax=Actinophytocola xanthii TaxID=1912961 RepID=A0A1Q8CMC5_9PSEU|nr:hydroxymethylbilane synthase [Actinophytocola xanthii]OLF15513.1 hydroxymethylbilane synthase [Actinophytocola xanthii]
MNTPLRLGTRRSTLALVQSRWVADALAAASGRAVELVPMSSAGDESGAPIASFGSVGVFVAALREALAAGEVDLVVHSYKDLPTAPDPRLRLAAVPVRADERDALVTRDGRAARDLAPGSRVGTGSPRRAAQLLAANPELELVPLRGNVDSRLSRVGELEGVVLAMAGLSRLDAVGPGVRPLPVEELVPAPAQGALAVECRADDPLTAAVVSTVEHGPTRCVVTAERAVLAGLDAGCTAPVGAHAHLAGGELHVTGLAAAPDGRTVLRATSSGPAESAQALGLAVAGRLRDAGAHALLAAAADLAPADPRSVPTPVAGSGT